MDSEQEATADAPTGEASPESLPPAASAASAKPRITDELAALRALGNAKLLGMKLKSRVRESRNKPHTPPRREGTRVWRKAEAPAGIDVDFGAVLRRRKEEERRKQRETQEMLRRCSGAVWGDDKKMEVVKKTDENLEGYGRRAWAGPVPVNAGGGGRHRSQRNLFEGGNVKDLRERFTSKRSMSIGKVTVEVRRRRRREKNVIPAVPNLGNVQTVPLETDRDNPVSDPGGRLPNKSSSDEENDPNESFSDEEHEYYEVAIGEDGVEFEIPESDDDVSFVEEFDSKIVDEGEPPEPAPEPAPDMHIPSPPHGKRLDPSVSPSHYSLRYSVVDLENFRFEGTVDIDVDVGVCDDEPMRRNIVLHSLELDISSATIAPSAGGDATGCESLRYSIPRQTVDLLFPFTIEAGKYVLSLAFSGCLNDSMHGFYRSAYAAEDGTTRHMATTQFEATDARRAFPCFDEPAMKATFSLSVVVPGVASGRMLTVISNTPSIGVSTVGGQREFTFQKTPRMSSYLVALIVGELDSISRVSEKSGVVTSVYSTPGKAGDGRFCLEVASDVLDLYSELYGVKYPLAKSDLIAIPDFNMGAMENWGAVTYRESKILMDAKATSDTTRRGIARTVCHELAHQWFGNLVTMSWWTELWLNEGFARYMEFIAIDGIFPEWRIWEDFVQGVMTLALDLDGMDSTHPVEVEVEDPDDISAIFDTISYAKGASIIRMIATLLGEEVFWRGMKIYLKAHAYDNATTLDLWEALSQATDGTVDVGEIMRGWTSLPGYPTLSVGEGVDGGGPGLMIERFHSGGRREGAAEVAAGWTVPLTALVEGDDGGPPVLQSLGCVGGGKDLSVALSALPTDRWFKLNANQTSFIRVNYMAEQWCRLSEVMHSNVMGTIDILGLVSDVFALAKGGYVDIKVALDVAWRFKDDEEGDYSVWRELSENLSYLASLYRSEPFYPKLQSFLRHVYAKQMARLGWGDEEDRKGEKTDIREGSFRATVIGVLGIRANDVTVKKEALRRFKAYVDDPESNPLNGDMRDTIFKIAIRENEKEVYSSLKSMHDKINYPEERRNCLTTMASVSDMGRHAEMIDFVLFSGKVRIQDIVFPLVHLSTTRDDGGRACWEYMKNNFERIHGKYGAGKMWPAIVAYCVRGLRATEEADEVENFFSGSSHPVGSGGARLRQALEVVRTKAKRISRDRDVVAEFLEEMPE